MPSNFRLHPGPSEHYVTRFSILSKSVFLILAISPVRLKPQVLHHFLGVTILMSDFFKASALLCQLCACAPPSTGLGSLAVICTSHGLLYTYAHGDQPQTAYTKWRDLP